jgi:hypothetical protein
MFSMEDFAMPESTTKLNKKTALAEAQAIDPRVRLAERQSRKLVPGGLAIYVLISFEIKKGERISLSMVWGYSWEEAVRELAARQ